jgi:hypothetical protein
MVETMDKWFGNVCELDIMFNIETVRHVMNWSYVCCVRCLLTGLWFSLCSGT